MTLKEILADIDRWSKAETDFEPPIEFICKVYDELEALDRRIDIPALAENIVSHLEQMGPGSHADVVGLVESIIHETIHGGQK